MRGSGMTCEEIPDCVFEMLQRRARMSYPALKRQFDLGDAYLLASGPRPVNY
jgi:hypothetical protein